jgi:hypothetical protein
VEQNVDLDRFPQLTWDEAAVGCSPAIRGTLERVLEKQDGGCLTGEERLALANSSGRT